MSFNPSAADFHPLANEYPMMPDREIMALAEVMKLHGFDVRFPIVHYEGMILDGRNRYLAARLAEVEPAFSAFLGNDEEAEAFVEMANEHRRHLAPEWLQRRRQERVERVAAARESGKSIPAIAAEEGISTTQVQRDLKTSEGLTGVKPSPADGKVIGTDGVSQPAKKPERPPKTPAEKPAPTPEPDITPEPNARPPKLGAVLFDFKQFYSEFGRIAQAPEKITTAYPDEKNGKDYHECRKHLSAFLQSFKAWQARLQKEAAE